MTTQKIYGLLIIVLGIPFGITALDGRFPPAIFVCAGLIPLFFGAERINDERVQQLKMKALYLATSAGLGLSLLGHGVLNHLAPQWGIPARDLSAYEFLAGILLISLGVFHFLRWQDARPGPEA